MGRAYGGLANFSRASNLKLKLYDLNNLHIVQCGLAMLVSVSLTRNTSIPAENQHKRRGAVDSTSRPQQVRKPLIGTKQGATLKFAVSSSNAGYKLFLDSWSFASVSTVHKGKTSYGITKCLFSEERGITTKRQSEYEIHPPYISLLLATRALY
ncbi:uncharacterized protein BDR25DRAFT_361385 [Lindgomyces ingoldianus]|uniref:Uncharacterized protein n=1 Tax=Lindgomyces ingoldianus TaxID=673940 RepID=A0ACB6QDH3_9PLEO|nr:uncharacterized protein BDR25DRAFT_361385 [Lindgomyces ingoldianus]KAF2464545.1 hypothetical protein BDR25DRAFT_361385 [Lindgomyces ingoldianus]